MREESKVANPRRAFTLVEVLLVIALFASSVALVAGVVVSSSKNLAQRPPEVIFFNAIKRAKSEASHRGRSAFLSFDRRGFFIVGDIETGEVFARIFLDSKKQAKEKERLIKLEENSKSLNSPEKKESSPYEFDVFFAAEYDRFLEVSDDSTKFTFFAIYPKLVNSVFVKFAEAPLAKLKFSPDGIMTRARVVISKGGDERVLQTDIFCGAPKGFERNAL